MSDSSQHELWYIEEATRGTTPATPAWKRVRDLSCTLGLTKNNVISEENRGDRQMRHLTHTTRSVDGDIGTYLYYGDNDDLIEAAMCGDWTVDTPTAGTDQLKVGVERRYFSFMRVFNDMDAGADKYHIFTGVEVSTMSIGMTTEGYVSLSFTTVGVDVSSSTAAPAGSTYIEPVTDLEPMVAVSAVIKEGGSTIATITEFSPTVENSIEQQFSIGTATPTDSEPGNSNSTGQIVTYFNDTVMYDKFVDETSSSLESTCTDSAGNTLRIVQPNIVYTGTRPDTAASGAILLTMPYQALYDDTEATNMFVERNPI